MFSNDKNLQKVQKSCFELLKNIVNVCEKEKLTYFIVSGTLIGSLRHEGFIPWDDDIDIAMPRKDYEKLIKIANGKLPSNMRLEHYSLYKTKNDFKTHHVQIVDNNVNIIRKWTLEEEIIHPWIDIFPLDGIPKNRLLQYYHYLKYRFWHNIMQISILSKNINVKKKNRPLYQVIVIKSVCLLNIGKKWDTIKILKIMDKIARKYPFDYSSYIVSFHGTYKLKEILPKDYFTGLKKFKFEGFEVNGPKNYDLLLKHYYGNYMEMPCEEDRINKHDISYIDMKGED